MSTFVELLETIAESLMFAAFSVLCVMVIACSLAVTALVLAASAFTVIHLWGSACLP